MQRGLRDRDEQDEDAGRDGDPPQSPQERGRRSCGPSGIRTGSPRSFRHDEMLPVTAVPAAAAHVRGARERPPSCGPGLPADYLETEAAPVVAFTFTVVGVTPGPPSGLKATDQTNGSIVAVAVFGT